MDFISLVTRGVDKYGIDPDNLNLTTTDPMIIGMQKKYCELGKCPFEWAMLDYRPTIAGNSIYIICFFALWIGQAWWGIRNKTWAYFTSMSLGILGEIIGYIGRVMLNQNPFLMNNFLVNLVPLTIAPAFFTAAIYLCLGRVITAIGFENSRLKPKLYTIIFVSFDVFSLILQAAGGAMAATAKTTKGSKNGAKIMVVGLISQIVSMVLFFAFWGDFVLRTRRAKMSGSLKRSQPPLYDTLRKGRQFKLFQWSLFVATVLIFIRCLYRVAELWDGFSSHLANDEATFMIFEGPLIILAVASMTVFHPGRIFGNLWVPAGKGVRSLALGKSASTMELTTGHGEHWKSNTNTAYTHV
ncbi:RTA1-domain-containing protein [Amniculicola lignicola CBS 123094]|uniref:RTA1-domain-containing protein n=1 Tax=Amniculicola lignicola CBS 123094 TaxID=1392246 RepID=A0A6A5WCR8_9PLEO|nr:RTA1-domain-containing protein [Amniculicola lignicola CBS 123094]